MRIFRVASVIGLVGSVWLACAATAHAGTPVELATPAQKTAAQTEFKKAMKAYEAKKWDDALAGFRASYDQVASPNSRLMAARTLAQLGRVGEAYSELESVALEAERAAQADPKYADTAKSARAEMDEVRPKTGFVTLSLASAPGDARVKVGALEIPRADWSKPVPVDPGSVSVALSSTSGEQHKDVTVAAGATVSVEFGAAAPAGSEPGAEPGPEPAPASGSETHGSVSTAGMTKRKWAYVAGGVGAAGLLTFTIFGIMNNAKHSDLKDQCPDGRCPADLADAASTGRTYQTVANVGLVVGVLGAGAGAFLYLTSKPKEAQATSLLLGPGNVSVRGHF